MSDRSPRERGEASALEEAGSTIRREGRQLAGEAKTNAQRVAREQRDAVASFVAAVVGAASRGADELEESGFARSAAAVRRTAGEVGGLAERLQERDPSELWDDIEGFARDHPAVVFGAGFALAFGIGRFLRSGARDDAGEDDRDTAARYEGAASYSGAGAGGAFAGGTPTAQPGPAAGATPSAGGV